MAQPDNHVELTVSVTPVTAVLAVTGDEAAELPSALSTAVQGGARVYIYRLTPGPVRIKASATGYHPHETVVSVDGPGGVGLGIMLSPESTVDNAKSMVVDAGTELAAIVGEPIRLNGTLATDGIVERPVVTWTNVTGPGDAAFDNPDAVATFATFSEAGLYTLELRATAEGLSVSDSLVVSVIGGGANEPATDIPEVEPPVPDPVITERLGLHVTQQELDVWRTRAASGPYRVRDDVSLNSPGDWARIISNADQFVRDPRAYDWTGMGGDTCVTKSDLHFIVGAQFPRDAAFAYLITEDARYRDAVRDFLLRHANNPRLDMSDRSRWCLVNLNDASFFVANWFTTMLFTYDYLGEGSFSSSEHDKLARWFLNAADFFELEANQGSLDKLFMNRRSGDYTPTAVAKDNCGRLTHYGGWKTCALHLSYNNRRASQVRFYGLAGIKFGRADLVDSSKLFVKEFVKFSVFPDGVIGEYERWRSDLPDLGWAYAAATLGSMVTIADHLARLGDFDLYEYRTADGALGSEGGDKSLRLAMQTLQALVTGERSMYGTDVGTGSQYLVDGVHAASGWQAVHDILIAPANLYYDDGDIRAVYTRKHPSVSPYPASPAGVGALPVWMGESGVYPGILFMFGELEHVAGYKDNLDSNTLAVR